MPSYIPPTLLALPFHLTSGSNKQGRQAAEIPFFILKPSHVCFFHPAFRQKHASKDLCSQRIILQSQRHMQRRCEVCMIAATQSLMNTIALGKQKKAVIGASPSNCYSTESHFCLRSRHQWELGGDTSERFRLFTVKPAQQHPA